MYYLYGSKHGKVTTLVATFDSEPQLLAYVRWATLDEHGGGRRFEKGSKLVNFHEFRYDDQPLNDDDPTIVDHNPSPSML